jgi:LPS sulfotransferase NodH
MEVTPVNYSNNKFQKVRTPSQYVFLASEARSGSTYFANSICYSLSESFGASFRDLGRETFSNARESNFDSLKIANSIYTNEHGFRCAKILVNELSILLKDSLNCNKLAEIIFGPNTHWIILRRRNRIKHAVSLACAIKTGTYHFYDDPKDSPDANVHIYNNEIMDSLRSISLSDIYLENLPKILNKSETFFYEDFIQDRESVIKKICLNLGFEDINQLKLSDAPNKKTNVIKKHEAAASFIEFFLTFYGARS